ncbi:hypothetical protein INT43_002560 [Umbelopsis isabellina]|uniref:CAP-Gly domain-containing protein n=1 Tax=Mortierella isabellina TaxID=91625 RepID=A0A8H7Q540_MORIS|nr:hypothetical protein INT43_002560 [Umbelopsis isabellina]
MSRLPKGSSTSTGIASPYGTIPRSSTIGRYSDQHAASSTIRKSANGPRVTDSQTLQPRASKSTTLRRGNTTSRSSATSLEDMFQDSNRYSTGSSQSGRTTPQRSSVASSATTISPRPSKSTKTLNRASSLSSSRRSVMTAPAPQDGTLHVGQRVAVHSLAVCGTLRYLGPTDFKSGIWAGVELDIIGTGKNDGSVNGIEYFTCPPQTGLFLLSTKVSSLSDPDTDSVRSESPSHRPSLNGRQRSTSSASSTSERQGIRTASAHNAALAAARISSGSRASRYLSMTANQLSQGRPTSTTAPKTRKSMTPLQRSSTNSASRTNTPTLRKSHIPPSNSRRISTASLSSSAMASPTPPPQSPDYSRHSYVSSNDGAEDEALHHRLQRLLGDAISQAPDESAMRLQQLQLRVEVLEAENKFLKLENAQNKSAEQILEKSLLLQKQSGESDAGDFALDGHQAIVDQLKSQMEENQQKWEAEKTRLEESKQKLATQIEDFDKERQNWNNERETSEHRIHETEREKERNESRIRELDEKLAVSEANYAAALAKQAATRERNTDSPYSEEMEDHRRRLEAEMEEVHEKMANLTEAMRAKDMFLQNMSEQVETYRNMCEEKEREIRRSKSDVDREKRDKDRLLDEVSELETRLREVDDAGETKNQLEKRTRELEEVKRRFEREKRELVDEMERNISDHKENEEEHQLAIRRLEQTVEELKKAGFESLELYENSFEVHNVEIEKLNATIAEERRKNKLLDTEREELRKAGLDAIEAYETTIGEMSQKQEAEKVSQADQIRQLQEEASELRKQLSELVDASQGGKEEEIEKIKLVWEAEKKRLAEQLEAANERILQEQQQQQALQHDIQSSTDLSKKLEKLTAEKQTLEKRVVEFETDYQQLNDQRHKGLEDIGNAIEAQKKAEAEYRKLQNETSSLKRELEQQADKLSAIANEKEQLELAIKDRGEIAEVSEQTIQLASLQQQIEKYAAQNQMLVKQKEQLELTVEQLEKTKAAQLQSSKSTTTSKDDQKRLKELVNKAEKYEEEIASLKHTIFSTKKEMDSVTDDNKKLNAEYEKLLDAHKSVENECLKLMDEVERLHSEGLVGLDVKINGESDDNELDSQGKNAGDPKIKLLQSQLAEKQTQVDRLLVQHSAQLREVQQKLSDLDRNKQREIHALNKDIAELESLIESKIFKEADLEEAIELERKTVKRLREELNDFKSQHRDSSYKPHSNGKMPERKAPSSAAPAPSSPAPVPTSTKSCKENLYCEICEKHGHDIISCTALLSEADYAAEAKRDNTSSNERPYCENCEEYGLHATENCPNGDETF